MPFIMAEGSSPELMAFVHLIMMLALAVAEQSWAEDNPGKAVAAGTMAGAAASVVGGPAALCSVGGFCAAGIAKGSAAAAMMCICVCTLIRDRFAV